MNKLKIFGFVGFSAVILVGCAWYLRFIPHTKNTINNREQLIAPEIQTQTDPEVVKSLETKTSSQSLGVSSKYTSVGESNKEVPIVYYKSTAETAFNHNDVPSLVGASHNIYIAKIVKQVGTETWGPLKTQFEAQVILNIKGKLSGSIVMDVLGGYKDGKIYIKDGGVWPKIGSTYFFITRYNSRDGWPTFNNNPWEWELISSDVNLSEMQLKELALKNNRVQGMQSAYPKEVLLDADVKQDLTLNSYTSLSEQEKAVLPYYSGYLNTTIPSSTPSSSTQ